VSAAAAAAAAAAAGQPSFVQRRLRHSKERPFTNSGAGWESSQEHQVPQPQQQQQQQQQQRERDELVSYAATEPNTFYEPLAGTVRHLTLTCIDFFCSSKWRMASCVVVSVFF
jgi:hypothetical protein